MPLSRFRNRFRLPKEEAEQDTYTEIEEGVHFRGHNLWLLVISMVIACVGLNINSPAAVIGAMLISPLMGPIVGLSFGLSIGDHRLARLSVRNWLVMVFTALLASTAYFFVTPFHAETSQLSAFKQATVFDCILALFGGFAWFLGIIRKEAIKVIAGVAVATACIPPLCTAGYGLANLNAEYFLGGLYFYVINCVYIGIGTWVLSILLGYQRYYLPKNVKTGRYTGLIVSVASLFILAPSALFTYRKWQEESLSQQAEQYIRLIRKLNPEIAILQHHTYRHGNRNYLDITILNDSTYIPKAELEKHDELNKDIRLIWHYSKNSGTSSDIRYLQKQINELRQQLENSQPATLREEAAVVVQDAAP